MIQQEIVERLLKKSYLLSPDLFGDYDGNEEILIKLDEKNKPLVLNKDLFTMLKKSGKVVEINWLEFEKSRTLLEKGRDDKVYKNFLDILFYEIDEEKKRIIDNTVEEIKRPESKIIVDKYKEVSDVVVLRSYNDNNIPIKNVNSFVNHFKFRYDVLKDILLQRAELNSSISIGRALGRKDRSLVSVIGLVNNQKITRNGNVLFTLEDPTGVINVLVIKDNYVNNVKDLVLDEVVGVMGYSNGDILFCEKIYFPDIPVSKEIKKCSKDVCVAFISDIHVGSKNFLEKEFLRFINWLNLDDVENKQLEIVKKIKYLFVLGDLVDGVGVFPDQIDYLTIKDVNKQYEQLAKYLSLIRRDIKIIMCPGDHDALRLAHPQPPLDKKIAPKLCELQNVILVSNPSLLNIEATKDFPGFDVLLYHGHGYHYYYNNVDSLKQVDAAHNPRHVMKFLLQKRHLAPSHTSTIYVPDNKEDFMVIKTIPDIFVSGHLHKCDISAYNNVITINCSCWQTQTDYEIKTGNFPDPCKVPILNLKSREIEVFDFNEK